MDESQQYGGYHEVAFAAIQQLALLVFIGDYRCAKAFVCKYFGVKIVCNIKSLYMRKNILNLITYLGKNNLYVNIFENKHFFIRNCV